MIWCSHHSLAPTSYLQYSSAVPSTPPAPASQVMRAGLIVAMMLASVVASCDECREYSAFTCRQIESADYNVYFYYPSGTERYLGRVNGLPQCGRAAHGFAASQNLSGKEWGYVCCMIARDSDCYEKHR
jgi:hypothetical protein